MVWHNFCLYSKKNNIMSKEKNIKIEGDQKEEKLQDTPKNEENKNEKEEKKEEEKAEKEEDPLEKANKEIAELKDKYLRSVAEFDNYRKRTLKEKADLILNGGEKTVKEILPVLDDLERAIEQADKTDDLKTIREGMKLIHNKFVNTLEKMGVKKIDTKDKDFDTEFHEAVAMVPGMGDEKKGKVIDCVQHGYTMNDKVIRHAKVAVGQ